MASANKEAKVSKEFTSPPFRTEKDVLAEEEGNELVKRLETVLRSNGHSGWNSLREEEKVEIIRSYRKALVDMCFWRAGRVELPSWDLVQVARSCVTHALLSVMVSVKFPVIRELNYVPSSKEDWKAYWNGTMKVEKCPFSTSYLGDESKIETLGTSQVFKPFNSFIPSYGHLVTGVLCEADWGLLTETLPSSWRVLSLRA